MIQLWANFFATILRLRSYFLRKINRTAVLAINTDFSSGRPNLLWNSSWLSEKDDRLILNTTTENKTWLFIPRDISLINQIDSFNSTISIWIGFTNSILTKTIPTSKRALWSWKGRTRSKLGKTKVIRWKSWSLKKILLSFIWTVRLSSFKNDHHEK